jgi:hypothetical protein
MRHILILALLFYWGSCVVLAQGSLETFSSPGGQTGSIDWSAAGKIEATGFGIGAANSSSEAQKKVTARTAAKVDAQRQLLEIIQGVSVYNGVLTSDRMLANDTVVTQVMGVLRGAVIVPESETWDSEAGLYTLTMTIALSDLRDAVAPTDMEASLDLENLIRIGTTAMQAPETPSPATDSAAANTSVTADPNQAPTPTTVTTTPPTPVANNDSFETTQGGTLTQNVLTNDTNITPPTQVTLVGNVAHGTVTLTPDGSFSYKHDGSATATDVFKYSVSSGATTVEAFVTLSIALTAPAQAAAPDSPVNTAPVANSDTYNVNQGGVLEITAPNGVLANDVGSSTLLVISNGGPKHGTLTLFPEDGSFTYAHNGDSATSDTFVYTANDGTSNSNEATVTITITPGIQAQTPATQTTSPTPSTSPQPAPVTEGGTALSARASPSAVGGGSEPLALPSATPTPITGELPTGIILDASSYPLKTSFFMTIFSTSGEVIKDKVRASYFENSLETAKQHQDVAITPEVIPVFELSPNEIDIVLSDEATLRFKSLIMTKDFVTEGHLLILRQE